MSTTLRDRGISVDPHRFNANHDIPPSLFREMAARNEAWITRNGDYRFYAEIFQRLEAFFASLRSHGIMIPDSHTIADRAEYLVFQIRTVSHLYRLSNLVPGIGGGIRYMTITPAGIESEGVQYY
ncbi:MAG: hypothetical protein ABIJ00_12680 [Candidatus Eisenbacteria bacterium]